VKNLLQRDKWRISVPAAAVAMVLMLAPGCTHFNLRHGPRVAPFASRDVAVLSAEQVVTLMRRAGFSDRDIWKAGVDLRNALSRQGAARVLSNDHTAAIFVVHNRYIQVASWNGGSFLYDTYTGQFR